jgi:hypothetical protein
MVHAILDIYNYYKYEIVHQFGQPHEYNVTIFNDLVDGASTHCIWSKWLMIVVCQIRIIPQHNIQSHSHGNNFLVTSPPHPIYTHNEYLIGDLDDPFIWSLNI